MRKSLTAFLLLAALFGACGEKSNDAQKDADATPSKARAYANTIDKLDEGSVVAAGEAA
ncbi:MAG: hypothetical protein GF419_03185, partial [Ignavibacteriales bacterium]|nr:hypothetical protein [Ignavibacteriales bacterium]